MPVLVSTSVQELAILRVLAHVGCASTQHLHALVFPQKDPVTARTCLRGLLDAGWITRTNWRLPYTGRTRGHIWAITRCGLELLHRYDGILPPTTVVDLGRPSTSLEMEEWEARMGVRSMIVRLIVAARRRPLFAQLSIQIAPLWPTLLAPAHLPTPDAELRITWEEPTQQANDWLPWSAAQTSEAKVGTYAVYFDRASLGSVVLTLDRWLTTAPADVGAALLVWVTDERLDEACHQLQAVPAPTALRMTSWSAVDHGMDEGRWRDAAGAMCSLQLRPQDMVRTYHDVSTA